ncbi:MAG TPA: hypothetical protein VLL95_04055 [Phnomibacter sp.]|nr:hypothetical protein [Phnomibacter sp.]
MDSPIFVYMQVSSKTGSVRSKAMVACIVSYALGLLALFLPAEIIVNAGERFAVSLWFQHTGKVVGAFLLVCGLIQLFWWRQTSQWLTWPAWLCSAFVLLFAIRRGGDLFGNSSSTLAGATAGIGLYLLAAAALLLMGANFVLSRQKNSHPQ